MSGKRSSISLSIGNAKRRKSAEHLSYFQRTLQECGLILKKPGEKCEATNDIVYIVRDLKKSLKQHDEYPENIETFLSEFKRACSDNKTFEHYLFLNVIRKTSDKTYNIDESVIKILLNVTFLQTKLVNYIFDRVMDVWDQTEYNLWVKMILKSFSNLDTVESSGELSTNLINLLDVSSDKLVKLEIITAIPDIIGDREHDNVASEMSRILSNDSQLIPAILECLTYLCLSDSQFEQLQKDTLRLLQPSNAAYFSNFVKFLLSPGRLTDSNYEETVKGLRKELTWSSIIAAGDLATSQILTAKEIRNSMLSSKTATKAWIKVISSCSSDTEHKPIDVILLLIMASLSDDMEKEVKNVMRKQIRLRILTQELFDKAFETFKPILEKYSPTLINIANSLLKPGSEPSVEMFGAHMHMVMYSRLTECRPIIVNELLRLVIDCKKSALNTLNVLNDIASKNLTLMKEQSTQMLVLLDKLDDMKLTEIKSVMNLLCGLAFGIPHSDIRDDLYITIRKELGSSIPSIKTQGILAGVHAVKYLMQCTTEDVEIPEDVTLNMTNDLPRGDLLEAAKIIEMIHHSTEQFPDKTVFFYDELYKIILEADVINKTFLSWLTSAFTHYWQENFIVDAMEKDIIDDIRLSKQLRLNLDSEMGDDWAVNIAGLTLEDNKEINIEVLSSLFQLVRILHYKKENGDLSNIDALLGCSIVMPDVDVGLVSDLSDSQAKNILDCYITCVNWIRELLNAFVSQEDIFLKPKVLKRLAQLKNLEENIEKIKNGKKKNEHDDTAISGSKKSQQTQMTQITKIKPGADQAQFRPLDLKLIHVIQYDLTPEDSSQAEITFEILTYLLRYINPRLEKVLIPRIKKETFLSKGAAEIYNYTDAETQAQTIKNILPKLMVHVNQITTFLNDYITEEGTIHYETLNSLQVIESLQCLEYIYDLLTIYFRWIEFRNRNLPMLKSSLQIVAKVEEDNIPIEGLLIAVAKIFQEHEKYMITISTAACLVQFLKTLQELSTGAEVSTILKDTSLKLLSKEWKTIDNQPEKGLFYNQCLDILTKGYLGNNKIEDLKNIATSLVNEVCDLRDKTSILTTLKSINKSNFSILFRNLGAALCDKIKCHTNGGFTNEELLEMWATAACIFKLMSEMVTSQENKLISAYFLKKSIPVMSLFLSKGFPILRIEFKDHRQNILNIIKDIQTSTECLQNICSQASDRALMQKIPNVEELMTTFVYKTKDLLTENDCSETLKMFDMKHVPSSRSKHKRGPQQTVNADATVEDLDDDLPDDESNASSDIIDAMQLDSVGISDMI